MGQPLTQPGVSTPTPPQVPPTPPIQGMDMMAIFAQILAQQQAQSQMRQQTGREQQGGLHRDMSGNPIDATNHAGSLTGESQWRGMFPGAPGNVTAQVPQAQPVAPPAQPYSSQPGGLGFSGPMIHPQYGAGEAITNMPQMQQEYQDFYRPGGAQPYMAGLPQPAQQKKKTGASFGFGATASPRPGFGF